MIDILKERRWKWKVGQWRQGKRDRAMSLANYSDVGDVSAEKGKSERHLESKRLGDKLHTELRPHSLHYSSDKVVSDIRMCSDVYIFCLCRGHGLKRRDVMVATRMFGQ